METVYILQAITIVVSVVSVGLNVMISILTNNRKQISDIVAKRRLNHLQQYRTGISKLAAICNPEAIVSNEIKAFNYTLSSEIMKLAIIFKGVYRPEQEILSEIEQLKKIALAFYSEQNNKELKNQLETQLEKLVDLINIYDLAYWRFIINQATGKNISNDFFGKFYEKARNDYIESKSLKIIKE